MKHLIGVLCIFLLFFTFSCKKDNVKVTKKAFDVGSTVAAKWSDGNYYLAVISSISGESYNVNYADGTTGSVTTADILAIPSTTNFSVGDKVIAVWSSARFYPGTIEQLTKGGAMVKWDDGSAASEVAFGQIIKQ